MVHGILHYLHYYTTVHYIWELFSQYICGRSLLSYLSHHHSHGPGNVSGQIILKSSSLKFWENHCTTILQCPSYTNVQYAVWVCVRRHTPKGELWSDRRADSLLWEKDHQTRTEEAPFLYLMPVFCNSVLSRLRQLITDDDGRLQRTQEFQISSLGDCLQPSNDMTSPVAAAFKHIASLQQLRLIFFDRQGRMQHSPITAFLPPGCFCFWTA